MVGRASEEDIVRPVRRDRDGRKGRSVVVVVVVFFLGVELRKGSVYMWKGCCRREPSQGQWGSVMLSVKESRLVADATGR